MRNACTVLFGISEKKKRPLRISRNEWECNNIKINPQQIGCDCVDKIALAQDVAQ
jgi:hypothetical protein